MGTITSQRRGRQRKAVFDAKANGQSEGESAISSGNWQVRSDGAESTAKDDGSSKRISWLGLVEAVKAEHRLISRAWHPEAKADVIATNASDVIVLVGEPSYQLSTGEIVAI